MYYGVKIEVSGEFACFTRPEMKVERVSYDIITPSAARAILEAIYWKPQIRWAIDRIHVLAPIQFANIRRNEVGSKIPAGAIKSAMNKGSGRLGQFIEEERQQRASLLLRNVRYGIEAHFDVLDPHDNDGKPLADPAGKHLDMFNRRAAKGQYFHHPYLGCREFPADFKLVDAFPQSKYADVPERDLGYMLHDIDFAKGCAPRFFRAVMRKGIVEVPPFSQAKP